MKVIADWFRRRAESEERREQEREEAYLAESLDLCDLEYRMRQLDLRKRVSAPWIGAKGS
jgi:hypothetical protein